MKDGQKSEDAWSAVGEVTDRVEAVEQIMNKMMKENMANTERLIRKMEQMEQYLFTAESQTETNIE